ncbi:hypothetical protein J6590_001975 [Homalodisca vitripennis]|nr:hypothetical protein J6590_001975 [Homalodisca vitripennis]
MLSGDTSYVCGAVGRGSELKGQRRDAAGLTLYRKDRHTSPNIAICIIEPPPPLTTVLTPLPIGYLNSIVYSQTFHHLFHKTWNGKFNLF